MRLATIFAMNAPASCRRFGPSKRRANARASARSLGLAGANEPTRRKCEIDDSASRKVDRG